MARCLTHIKHVNINKWGYVVTTDRTTSAGSGEVFRLVYRSHDLIAPERRRVEHGALFTHARANNKAAGITGALLLSGDWFVQALEGDESDVRSLFARIERDDRHDMVELLDTREQVERVFPRWSMAQVAEDDGGADTYLIAHTDGIAAASSRGTSPAQESVLDSLRAAARGAATVS